MKYYNVKPEFYSMWGEDVTANTVITEDELERLSQEWGKPVEELREQLIERGSVTGEAEAIFKLKPVERYYYDLEVTDSTGSNGGPKVTVMVTAAGDRREEITLYCVFGDTEEDMRVFSGKRYSVARDWNEPIFMCKTVGEAMASDFADEFAMVFSIADGRLKGTEYCLLDRMRAFLNSPEIYRLAEEKHRECERLIESYRADFKNATSGKVKIKFPKRD